MFFVTDTSSTPLGKALDNKTPKGETGKSKWTQWSPLSVLMSRNEKKQTVDDTSLKVNQNSFSATKTVGNVSLVLQIYKTVI